MNQENKGPDRKKGIPAIFIFLIIAGFSLLLMKNTTPVEKANVSFSHQVEHLVNLDLLDEKSNHKVAINDNLVSFSGKFRDKKTAESKNRFQYLTFVEKNNTYAEEKSKVQKDLYKSREDLIKSSIYFMEITGPKSLSFDVIVPKYEEGETVFQEVKIDRSKIKAASVNLRETSALYNVVLRNGGQKEIRSLGKQLNTLVANFKSSKLGIGERRLKDLLIHSENLLKSDPDVSVYGEVIGNLKRVVAGLITINNGVRLYGLRNLRDYLEEREAFEKVSHSYAENHLKMKKSEAKVSNVIWFYNNKEVSTSTLATMNSDDFHRFYVAAKKEWEAFAKNEGLAFRSPDQPRNLVLEKTFKSKEPDTNYFSYIFTFLPIILIGAIMYFLFTKQMKGGNSGAMNFGKSPAKQIMKGQQKITFDDVAGIDEAKEELEELVDFLKDPMRYRSIGARIPKGILLVGAPGTGKTLTAKAVAGEADVPFYSISGSDFVEMFVGVGASRVRDLFEQARKNSPSIIFIDEIDAVGRHRGSGLGGGHDEREQTLNQLLVEIDGMDTVSGVIILAATNRPDVLDKALLRPGRFDRSVTVEIPDYFGRLAILKVHAKTVKMADNVDLKEISRRTSGSVGADLENILNEAALHAAKKRRKMVTQDDLRYAQEKVQFGKERKSMVMNDEDIKTTAWHEAGHALISMILNTSDSVTMVTRVPRGQSLGATHFELKKNRVSYRRQELIDQMVVLMGGRCAEEIINKDPTSGAQMDIKMATNIARSMVCQWGMSDKIGMVNYGDDSNSNLMAGFHEREFSDETARLIDAEIKRFLDEAYTASMKILNENHDKLSLMSTMLIEFEALDKQDLDKIISGTFSVDDKKKKVEDFESGKKRSPPPFSKNFKGKKKPKQGPSPA